MIQCASGARRGRRDVAIAAVLCVALLSAGAAGTELVQFPIEIQGPKSGREATVLHFAAHLPDRPVRGDAPGLSPRVDGVPTVWEGPAEILWDFGDGSPRVNTGERASASHVYDDQGSYTITVVARDDRGEYARDTFQVEITNRDPFLEDISAIEIDPSSSTVELTATAQDAEGDPLELSWDFGDGEKMRGTDLWRVRHQYLEPGTYEVTLTLTDGDGGTKVEKEKVRVVGSDDRPSSERRQLDEKARTEVVETGFTGSVSGAVAADLDAAIRSFRGLYLQHLPSSGACRFAFTAWDDANLAYLQAVVDLYGIPPEGGHFYIHVPLVSLTFEPTAEAYRTMKTVPYGPLANQGLGALARGALEAWVPDLAQELSAGQRATVAERAGVEPAKDIPADAGAEAPTMPPRSPTGSDERLAFLTRSGDLDLVFVPGDRATGRLQLRMVTSDVDPRKVRTVQLEASLALDLAEARRDGVVRYEGCEPQAFDLEETWPPDGMRHQWVRRPKVWATFSSAVDPATVDGDTFLLTHPDRNGEPVPVAGHILREDRRLFFVPDQPLLPGVEFTARLRAGDDGVRSRAGSPLEDTEGTGWRSWRFYTTVDMVPEADGSKLLACHLFQTARDAPLVPGKPAVARIYASWQRQPDVVESGQVDQFSARVVIKDANDVEVAARQDVFVRPDLWSERGLDLRAAEHTVQVTGIVPSSSLALPLKVELQVPKEPGSDRLFTAYSAVCPTEIWDRRPTLTLDFVALPFFEWSDPKQVEDMLPALERIAAEARTYALQMYPVAEIESGRVRILPFPPDYRLPPRDLCDSFCLMNGNAAGSWWTGFDAFLRSNSSADIVVAFGPHGVQDGGSTGGRLHQGRGAVLMLVGPQPDLFSRFVQGTVHEIGHALGLEHLPFIANGPDADEVRKKVVALRDGEDPILYRGIEGLRVSRDGGTVWNKSAVEGNEEDDTLGPLMFPGTLPMEKAFIANHHYREVQRLFERLAR